MASSGYANDLLRGLAPEELSTLLNLVNGDSSSSSSPSKNNQYVTVSFLDHFKRQLQESLQREINLQVEKVRKGVDEKCDALLVKVPILESRCEEIANLRRELEAEKKERKEYEQGFLISVDNLMEEIVQLGVKVCDLEGRVAKIDGIKSPAKSERSTSAISSSTKPAPVQSETTEFVQMITELSKDIQAKFLEMAEGHASFRTDFLNTKTDFDKRLMTIVSDVNKTCSRMDIRIKKIEKEKISSTTTANNEPPEALVGMITDLSKDIQAKFLEFEESQSCLRMMIENNSSMKQDRSDYNNSSMEPPLETGTTPKPLTIPTQHTSNATLTGTQHFESRMSTSSADPHFHPGFLPTMTPPGSSMCPPFLPQPNNQSSIVAAHFQRTYLEVPIQVQTQQVANTQVGMIPTTSSTSGFSSQSPYHHGRDPGNPSHCLCGIKFILEENLDQHVRYFASQSSQKQTVQGPPPDYRTCCEQRFYNPQLLQTHLKSAHLKRALQMPDSGEYNAMRHDRGLGGQGQGNG